MTEALIINDVTALKQCFTSEHVHKHTLVYFRNMVSTIGTHPEVIFQKNWFLVPSVPKVCCEPASHFPLLLIMVFLEWVKPQ